MWCPGFKSLGQEKKTQLKSLDGQVTIVITQDTDAVKLRVWDTSGMKIGQTVVFEDINLMLDGHIKSGYEVRASIVSLIGILTSPFIFLVCKQR